MLLEARHRAVVLAVALALAGTVVGLRSDGAVRDVDEAVFRGALTRMAAGEGYYDAMSTALVAKEGRRPSEVRALRPPTLFVVLHRLPPASWRVLAGVVAAIGMVLAGRLAGPRRSLAGVALAGAWFVPALPLLYLHGELWGAPLLLGALLAVRRDRDDVAAGALVLATALRELFVVALVAGFVLRAGRRRPWAVGLAVVGLLASVHWLMAAGVLDPAGGQVSLGNESRSVGDVLRLLGPGTGALSAVVGVGTLALGLAGAWRRRGSDPAARLVLVLGVLFAVGVVVATRGYWLLCVAPALAAYAVTPVTDRSRAEVAVTPPR